MNPQPQPTVYEYGAYKLDSKGEADVRFTLAGPRTAVTETWIANCITKGVDIPDTKKCRYKIILKDVARTVINPGTFIIYNKKATFNTNADTNLKIVIVSGLTKWVCEGPKLKK